MGRDIGGGKTHTGDGSSDTKTRLSCYGNTH